MTAEALARLMVVKPETAGTAAPIDVALSAGEAPGAGRVIFIFEAVALALTVTGVAVPLEPLLTATPTVPLAADVRA
jgi:hypothetical protein